MIFSMAKITISNSGSLGTQGRLGAEPMRSCDFFGQNHIKNSGSLGTQNGLGAEPMRSGGQFLVRDHTK